MGGHQDNKLREESGHSHNLLVNVLLKITSCDSLGNWK